MSLKLILGASGSGKSTILFDEIIKRAMEHPNTNYIVVVPEQFTMSTQKELVRRHPRHSISNIDVVSFARLAFRVMEETGRLDTAIVDEIGKSLILRKIARENSDKLTVLRGNMDKIGYISEMKSVISEFTQYRIDMDTLQKIIQDKDAAGALKYKLQDIYTIYEAFRNELQDICITSEEVLNVLADNVEKSKLLENSVIAFDGFTGFTPIQYGVIEKLLKYTKMLMVTVTIDKEHKAGEPVLEHELFKLSKVTIDKLNQLANENAVKVEESVLLNANPRLDNKKDLLFLENNIFRYKKITYPDKAENISIHICSNPEKELEYIAGEICRLVREEGLRYREISIVTGDVDTYARYAAKVMDRYNIPVFMDYKRDVMRNPFIEGLRAVLSAVDDNLSYASMFRFIKSGLIEIEDQALFLLENYCIANGIKGHKKWLAEWTNRKNLFTAEEMLSINKAKELIIEPFEKVYKVCHSKKTTVKDKSEALYNFMRDLNMQEYLMNKAELFKKNNDLALEKEYSQIFAIVVDLLDEYVQLLGNEKMELSEYMQILDAGFSEARIGIIPPGLDQVTLGDITRTRLGDIRVLFFAGVNEGIIPASDCGGGIISQTERELLAQKYQLAPTVREKTYIQRFYLYMNLTKPSSRLYISYSMISADGSGVRPSYLITNLVSMFGKDIVNDETDDGKNEKDGIRRIVTPQSALAYLTENFNKARENKTSPLWRDLFRWYSASDTYHDKIENLTQAAQTKYDENEDNLGENLAKELYGSILKNSVSRMEMYSRCAFSHFMAYGLKLKEREEFEFAAMDIGTLIHNSLEIFSNDMADKGITWQSLPEDMLQLMADQCVDAAVEEAFSDILHSSAKYEHMIVRLKNIMRRTVWALYKQMKAGKFVQMKQEYKFNIVTKDQDGNAKAWINGRIDRMDIVEEDDRIYVKIIDYKTGEKSFDLNDFYHGISIQLPVYLDAAMREMEKEYPDKKIIPAGLFYYRAYDPTVQVNSDMEADSVESLRLRELRPNGLFNIQQNIIDLFDNQTETGSSDVMRIVKKKDGGIKDTANAIPTENFAALRQFLNDLIVIKADEITSGRAEACPIRLDKDTNCKFCSFRAVCRFDYSLEGYVEKEIPKYEKDQLWKKICGIEEEEEDA